VNPQELLETIKAVLSLVWSFDGVKVIVGHTLINVVVAVAAAVKDGNFNLSRLSEFLVKKLLPYVSVYAIVKAFGEAAGLAALGPVVWGMIEASLAGDLADNLAKLGVPMPEAFKRLVVKV